MKITVGEVVVTTDEYGQVVAVTRQDEDGRILSIIWESPAPLAQEDEPVAWMHTSRENSSEGQDEPSYFDYTYIHRNRKLAENENGHIPLYTRPQPDKLRKAAEELLAYWYPTDDEMLNHYITQLRAALDNKE